MSVESNQVKKKKVSDSEWDVEYNNQKYKMYRYNGDYHIVDNNGDKVVQFADSQKRAMSYLKRERPTEEAKAEYEQLKSELESCESLDDIDRVLDNLSNARFMSGYYVRTLKGDARRRRDIIKERREFVARREEVKGKYFLYVESKLSEAGEWESDYEMLRVVDIQYGSTYLLIDEAETSIEEIEAKIEDSKAHTLGHMFQMSPRDIHERGLEELKDDLPVYSIGRENLTDGMTIGKRGVLFTKPPVRSANGAFIRDEKPDEDQVQRLIYEGRDLVRKDIRDEFARVKAIFFDLQNADGE